MLYHGNIAEIITGGNEKDDPGNTARDVVKGKTAITHFSYTGHERGKSTDNWNEAGQENCFTTMFFIEAVSSMEVFFFEKT